MPGLTCVIQASLQSTRLPGKVLMEVWRGKTMVQMVVEAALRAEAVRDILIQLPAEKAEGKLLNYLLAGQSPVSQTKPLKLVSHGKKDTPYDFSFMKEHGEDFFRVTADCPLIDPSHFGLLLEARDKRPHATAHYELVTHHDKMEDKTTYPDGWDIELIPFFALEARKFQLDLNIEAVKPPAVKPALPLRCSVNYWQDLMFVRRLAGIARDPNNYEDVILSYNEMVSV